MKTTIAVALSLAVGLTATAAAAQSGNASRGERLFNQQCKACHAVEQSAASPTGPNLHGVIGRKAGGGTGYDYSPAMAKAGIVWDDKTLADYLKDPKAFVPDTRMAYAGLKRQEQVDDMIAYLHKATP